MPQRLTKALNAGLWAAISYIQHPGIRITVMCFLKVNIQIMCKRGGEVCWLSLPMLRATKEKENSPRDQISDLEPYGMSARSSGHI